MRSNLITTDAADAIDADYIVVTPERRSPPMESSAAERSGDASVGMDMLRRTATLSQPRKAEGGSPLFWAGGFALAAMAFWVSGGHQLFRPGTSSAPTSELRIAAFNSRVDQSGSRATLVVDGEAINDGLDTAALPWLEIQVTSGNGSLTRYKLGTVGMQLAAGAVFPFSGRLDLPKHGVKTVSVAFVE